jgi:hypothetical protein
MNWRKGLFRTWIVFSVLWLTVWGVFGFLGLRDKTTFEFTDPTGLKFDVTAPVGTSLDEAFAFLHNSDFYQKRRDDCAKDHGPWCNFPATMEMPNTFALWPLLLKTLAGPPIFLVIGIAALWVAAGFKRSASK